MIKVWKNNLLKRREFMELKIEYMALDKLKPYEKNARKHQEADLKGCRES